MKQSLFMDFLGNKARQRVLECFLENRELELAVSNIYDDTNMTYKTIFKEVKELKQQGLVVVSRMSKHVAYYRINMSNEIIKHLLSLFDAVMIRDIKAHLK